MKEIIPQPDKELIIRELSPDKFIRKTNYADNEIYIVTASNSPVVMQEIGRLRELSFRTAGGGTGKDCDIDDYDTGDNPYRQLIVWNPLDKEIVGGYRFKTGSDIKKNEKGEYLIATAGLFALGKKFQEEYMPYTIELGRSFVQPLYQPTVDSRKGLFSLDNLWDGLGALIVDNPEMKYFFGKVTMFPDFNKLARDYILFFLKKYFPDNENLVYPKEALSYHNKEELLSSAFVGIDGYTDAYKKLNTLVRALDEHIPPLVSAYVNLSPTMKSFGTSLNATFGQVEETAILVTIADIFEAKSERYIKSYTRYK